MTVGDLGKVSINDGGSDGSFWGKCCHNAREIEDGVTPIAEFGGAVSYS